MWFLWLDLEILSPSLHLFIAVDCNQWMEVGDFVIESFCFYCPILNLESLFFVNLIFGFRVSAGCTPHWACFDCLLGGWALKKVCCVLILDSI